MRRLGSPMYSAGSTITRLPGYRSCCPGIGKCPSPTPPLPDPTRPRCSPDAYDFNRQITRDYFFTVNHHWLDVYHVDGFRYDCVPNYWDGPLGVAYARLVYETHQLTKAKIAQRQRYWSRFDPGQGKPLGLVQMAEQLEAPEDVLRTTYSNST